MGEMIPTIVDSFLEQVAAHFPEQGRATMESLCNGVDELWECADEDPLALEFCDRLLHFARSGDPALFAEAARVLDQHDRLVRRITEIV
jgi:hypothetical protein